MADVIEIEGLTKYYGDRRVVDDVSFSVAEREVFGFLGPNGSGKTTTMRMALDIIRPDAGRVALLGGIQPREAIFRIGYLPEDRGLLRKEKVLDILRYIGRLKGLPSAEAQDRGAELLHRVGLYEHRLKKVESLSRGMTQLVQFAASLIHDPELIILDEPFGGLDPLNVQLMKEILLERQASGATIVFSTHIMSDVEELCERVVLIDQGRVLLYGNLAELKRQRGASAVEVRAQRAPEALAKATRNSGRDGTVEHPLEGGLTPDGVLRSYLAEGIAVEKFEIMLPTLNEIFIEEVRNARGRG